MDIAVGNVLIATRNFGGGYEIGHTTIFTKGKMYTINKINRSKLLPNNPIVTFRVRNDFGCLVIMNTSWITSNIAMDRVFDILPVNVARTEKINEIFS